MGYDDDFNLQYQDIQGAALFNLRHTSHTFTRYIDRGSGVSERYRHICFFCDGYIDKTTVDSEAAGVRADESNCLHEYREMISGNGNHWHRCVKCYRVDTANTLFKTYSNNNQIVIGGLLITNIASITIPAKMGADILNQRNVNEIYSGAFQNQTTLTSVTIPSSVTTVGNSAFSGCINLREVFMLGSTPQALGTNVFSNTSSLLSIYVNSVTVYKNAWPTFSSRIKPMCEITNEHILGSWVSVDSSQHKRVCSECSFEQTGTHTISNSWVFYDTIYHAKICTLCRHAAELAYHSWGEWMYSDWIYHVKFCTGCDGGVAEGHLFNRWRYCPCGAEWYISVEEELYGEVSCDGSCCWV
jgi:hypothetical protein